MYENRREIMQDVFLTYLPARKFKTSRLTVNLIAGLDRASASANALLPAVLSRGTARYPDMEQLSAAMDTLYGATVDSIVRKKGERQCIGFAASFIDDAFTPHGEKLLEPVAALTGEMLLDPVTAEGHFLPDYVAGEKANLIDAIRSLRNDKRDWAGIRLMQEMCAGEPYSILRLGDEETAERIDARSLYTHSRRLLAWRCSTAAARSGSAWRTRYWRPCGTCPGDRWRRCRPSGASTRGPSPASSPRRWT